MTQLSEISPRRATAGGPGRALAGGLLPLLLVLLLSACSDSTSVFDMTVGACYSEELMDDLQSSMTQVDCAGLHQYELFYAYDLDAGSYPGEDAIAASADQICTAEFEKFVGVAFDDSEYYLQWLTPSDASWNYEADREVLCFITNETMTEFSGSARNAQR